MSAEPSSDREVSRRLFLARAGVLGAVAGAGATGGLWLSGQRADAWPLPGLGDITELLQPILAELSRDTLNGLTTFVVPGPDRYSQAQGTPRAEPGALDAEATDFMIQALDNFVHFPEDVARPVAAALTDAVSGLGIELPSSLSRLLPIRIGLLDAALRRLIGSGGTLPLSVAAALLLNLAATQVNPAAVNGPFLSPFARLTFAEKAKAFELLEGPNSDLVGALDTQLPEPLRASVSGLLRFMAGALLEFPAFGSYGEWAVLDRDTKALRATPVGWELTGYPGVSDGWDDFVGYYQDRMEVSD